MSIIEYICFPFDVKIRPITAIIHPNSLIPWMAVFLYIILSKISVKIGPAEAIVWTTPNGSMNWTPAKTKPWNVIARCLFAKIFQV